MRADIQKSCEFSWTINNFSTVKPGLANKITANFISDDCKYKISTVFYLAKDKYLVCTSCAPYEIESDAPKCFHKTTIYILNQSNRENLRHISRIDECAFGWSILDNYVFINSTKITKNHIKNDSIIIKIIIEPFLSNFRYSACSQNGTLIWKIDNYTKIKQDDIDGVTSGIYSDYFLSSKQGYKMKIQFLYDDSRDGIYVRLIFVKYEFDHVLKQKFHHKTTFAVIDQSDNSEKIHLIKTVENDHTRFEEVEFTSKGLENSTYLKNDCMIVKVSVESI